LFSKKQPPVSVESAKIESLIGANIVLTGDIAFANGLRIDGRIDGNITGTAEEKNLLILSDKGAIVGRVQVHDAIINGQITGDLVVTHFLELQANSRVNGNISYRQLKMDCGAVINGKLERMADENQHKALPFEATKKISDSAKENDKQAEFEVLA